MASEDHGPLGEIGGPDEADFFIVLHYDPDRPATNLFGAGPFPNIEEAKTFADAINEKVRAATGGCKHENLVLPMWYGPHQIVMTIDTVSFEEALEPPGHVH